MAFIQEALVYAPMYVALLWCIVLLMERRTKNRAKHFLGFFMMAAMFVYLCHAVFFTNRYIAYLFFDPLYTLASLLVYPLFYWYIKLLTDETTYDYRNLMHLLPAIVVSAASVIVYSHMSNPVEYVFQNLFSIQPTSLVNQNLWNLQRGIYYLSRSIFFLQIIMYLILGFRKIKIYKKQVIEFYSNLEGKRLDWAQWLLIIFSLTALMSILANFTGRSYFVSKQGLIIIPALVFSALIFSIGYLGFKQVHNIQDLRTDENITDSNEDGLLYPERRSEMVSNMAFIDLKKQLLILFDQERIHSRPDLKITQLSQLLKSNRTYVSKLINDEFGCSFNDFVNRYRINEVKQILDSETDYELTLEQIAEKTGFSSSAALIRIFKQMEGFTPGHFRRRTKFSKMAKA
jgi:AraC-like DNA-binding protein